MQLITRDLFAVAFALALIVFAPFIAVAAEATGEWLIEDGDARVRIVPCGGELCGNVAWIKEGAPTVDVNNPDPAKRSRPLLGSAVLLGLKPSGAGEWTGSLYDAENGRTYVGKLTIIDERHVKVAGCVLGGLICESQTWSRTK
ncbi:MAG: DUF2147 domain-containing protein [Hyphomicrobiales bacterium]|nr:DUF2147 domain-containing protein [Hyphomicrobiales bacterium]MBV9517827.1 DUF2147 domain-containing protein [Hyphomicrobiales bacterium]